MALDEALLQTAPARGAALLRVYSWTTPSVSFGYFQKFPADLAAQYTVIRRPTGGGVVYHVADTTYTVVVPVGHSLYKMSTNDAYCVIHKAVAAAFDHAPTLHTAPVVSPTGQYECFQKPVHGDVVADGRKLAGGAQRRSKTGMLHQGSIATRLDPVQLRAGFEQTLSVRFQEYELTAAERDLAARLAAEKYATPAWNLRVT